MGIVSQVDPLQARTFLEALGADLTWRLIRAAGLEGYWAERKDDPGQTPDRLHLDRMDASHSWHVRPMPTTGPFVLTMLDDADPSTIDRLIADDLPPTAVAETSPGRLQVWHRWPWRMPRDKAARLIRHLQTLYGTDAGANAPGHCGRLPGSRNWKRDPEKGIDRGGCPVRLVATGPQLTDSQARDWLRRYPVPAEPVVTAGPKPAAGSSDLATDPRYLALITRFDPAAVWVANYAKTGDESRADLAVAVRAVSLQLPDDHIIPLILAQMDEPRRKKHSPAAKYAARTVATARKMLGVPAPWSWAAGQFDPQKQFPWLSIRRGA